MMVLLLVISICFFIFSYLWIDKALILTLSSGHPVIKNLEILANFGDVNRKFLGAIYVILIVVFFILQTILILKNGRKLFLVFAITTLVFSFSYNFLSYDLFTYLFSAKMLWNYHLNPYLVSPEYLVPVDFSISFLRNIQHTYPYGVVSLVYSLLPTAILSGDRILLNIFSARILNAILFYATGVVIYRTLNNDKRVFGWWFFNPLLIMELLINSHNDLLLVSFFIIAICLFYGKKLKVGLLFLLAAALTKTSNVIYEALIFLAGGFLAFFREKYLAVFSKIAILGVLIFLQTSNIAVQVWYYTWIYCFVPFAKLKTSSLIIMGVFGTILLLGYYPYIRTGGWGGEALIPGVKILGIVLVLTMGVVEFRGKKLCGDFGRGVK